jgi:hypothetical protein
LKLKIGNNKNFEDFENIFRKIKVTNRLKIHWLNENGGKFVVFMKQVTKEYDFSECKSLLIKVHSVSEEDYNSLGLIRVKHKELWLDHGSYLTLNKNQ